MSRLSHKLSALVFVAGMLMASVASAHSTQSGDISVGHIWAYPASSNSGQVNAVRGSAPSGNVIDIFGPILNNGGGTDAVTKVTSGVAPFANIVMWIRGNQMTRDFPLALPPNQPVALGPQTQFIRLYGVNKLYKAGDSFPITFHFQNAPDATIDVIVQAK